MKPGIKTQPIESLVKKFINGRYIAIYVIALMMLAAFSIASCQISQPEFAQQEINRRVSEYNHEGIDQSSPLTYYLSRCYVMSEGKMGQLAKISTAKFGLDTCAIDRVIDPKAKQKILDEKIVKIVVYKDSAAAIITEYNDSMLILNHTWIENGKWVNGGQGLAENMEDAEKQLQERLPKLCRNVRRIEEVSKLPLDTKPFTDYLKQQTLSPEEFVLQQISTHRLVINGEYHRRKVSWDMLRRLVALPDFPKVCGSIFMELPSREQPTMDMFMGADKLNGELILSIFRNEQPNGWWDKGEYDFICDVWNLNQRLPQEEHIKIQLVDYQIPYSQIQSEEEYQSALSQAENRNTHMADVIEQSIKTSNDSRNSLFLVGCAHVYKSGSEGIASAGGDGVEQMTAGAQLAQRLGSQHVFTLFQHVLPTDNGGGHSSAIRGGIFDQAFAENGNRPVGFLLQGSPFGQEPFDGIYEKKYEAGTGTYQDNFDGYLFLHPLNEEPKFEPLLEVFSDSFVAELQRRSAYLGWNERKDVWFGHTISELTNELIHQSLLK